MKNLPIGIQTLPKLIERNCVYVDKTELVHQLVTRGAFYFLSRPRRFGKSLLISTLKELYLGNKTVFQGLWIENNWDWSKTNPVVHFSFDALSYHQMGLAEALSHELKKWAERYDIALKETNYKEQFLELLGKVSEKHGKIVFLVDEYDKPITDFLEVDKIEQGKANRDVLREFYGVLKSSDAFLEFVFITGISKFAKVSLFSHLNNLSDITLDEDYATITGYTQEELELYFDDYLEVARLKLNISREFLLENMRIWYDGFSWDGIHKLYNPFGTLNFLAKKRFQNFWFATGSPRFLIEQMKQQVWFNVENSIVNNTTLDKYDIDNVALIPLLFQTGYLTVKEADVMTGDMILDYPNKEVRESMYQFLIDDVSKNPQRTHTGRTIQDIQKALIARDLPRVQSILNAILEDLPSETYQNQSEGLYHGLVHLIFSYLGMFINSEVQSSKGRADAVVQTVTDIYIFEFKFNKTAEEALVQIRKKNYAGKYQVSGKTITGIGVNFNSTTKQIDDWLEEGIIV
jgi:hypothetical protein